MTVNNNNITSGVSHVAITVLDLNATVSFFVDVLGYDKVGEDPGYPAAFVSDGSTMLALWQAKDPANAVPFDRFNVIGLHHLAINVEDAQLDALHATLEKLEDCDIEFAPELAYGGPSRHFMANIPGSGIRFEFRTNG
ncbi:MAG: VOC family protein [Kofleriaceae bacterium]|nr:VOC family protein [Kofleriaceae bacterium]